ncbi:ABC transporter family protein [Bacillus thuringiensis]|uniref:ABC transporter family protein n=1 Tax=Bacillus thuringiensis TaxID=1428 RepID=A0A4R4AVX9_BACTU|nr:AAA family ATPase [Bacillus thuringiensis]TCW43605.1 ABC transporter family protein [Bacillus thuringiensis]TCW44451.1 ABC transporter family protein [Bacillus thuringiensis]
MELLYVWINKYHNIKKQGFNFSNKYVCEFDKENNINVDIKFKEIPEDFFKLNSNTLSEKNGQIMNITGIVGENGAGKSSVLDYIMEKLNDLISGEFRNFEKDEQLLAIVRRKNTLYIYSYSIIINQITITDPILSYEIINNDIKSNNNNYKIIYYSNVFDAKKSYYTDSNTVDLSTNFLLNNNEYYRLSEIQRQLNLIASSIKIELPFKYPDFLNCSFSSSYYLNEILRPENPYTFEDIVYHVFSNYSEVGTWERESRYSTAPFDMYNLETGTVIDCVYKEYVSEENNLRRKYKDLIKIVSRRILTSAERQSKINFRDMNEYIIATNLPYNPKEEFEFIEKIREVIEREFDTVITIRICYWDKIVELIESIPKIRQAYFKYTNVKEKIKINMLEYIPADLELQKFRVHALTELNNVDSFNQLKIRICLCYFLIFYRTNHTGEFFRGNWKEELMGDFFEDKIGTVSSILNFFKTCEKRNDNSGSRLGEFIINLNKLVAQKVVIIDENGKGFKIKIHGENIENYRKLILGEYNKSQEVFPYNYDYLDIDWYDMSSGEKAMFSLISRFYDARKFIDDAKHLLILIDEGETYFHPEWQRIYIFLLLDALPKIFSMKKIQIIFTSNTPLVISDLPRENIVFLESIEGNCSVRKSDKFRETFGANIHTLLSDSFFMKHGTIGNFAKEKIQYIIDLLNEDDASFKEDVSTNKINLKKIKKEISIIGEELIRNKLLDMYIRKVNKLDIEEEERGNNKKESILLQEMTIEDLQKFKKEIESVLRKREFNDKGNN